MSALCRKVAGPNNLGGTEAVQQRGLGGRRQGPSVYKAGPARQHEGNEQSATSEGWLARSTYGGRRDEETGDDQNRELNTTPTHSLWKKKSPSTGNRYPRSRRRLVVCGEM